MLSTVDQLSVSHAEGQHDSVQDAYTPGVDSVWVLIPKPCSMSALLSNIKNGVCGNK